MASRTDRFIDGMFSGRVNPKDGYAIVDCRDPRVKRVLEFLVPLLYPEKPTRVTITVGNTIFGALSGERPVDWGIVVKDLVQRLLSKMGKSKATPICPYIFHLYHSHELLLPAEKKEYRIKEALLKHNVDSKEEGDPDSLANLDDEDSSDDSDECESLTPSEIQEAHRKALDKLNLSLAFNQKLETYVGHTGDVVNKAQLFDANLAQHPVAAKKVIPVLVDFVDKMEELLDEMRTLFDGLQPEVPPVAAENLPDISGEIPSLTGWGRDGTIETPTKPDQPGPSELIQEKEAQARPELPHSPRTYPAGTSALVREVLVESIVGEVVRELEEEERASLDILTPTPLARIDVVQTRPEEQMAERMKELPTPPLGPTPEPISLATPMSLLRPSFLKQLETITKTPFKTPGQEPVFRLPVASPTAVSIGTDTQGNPEVFGSVRSADKGTETTSLAPQITRSVAKQTPGSSPCPKRVYLSLSKGSSSKRRR